MAQMNLHLTPEFERDLARLMKLRGIRTKSEAVRVAVREGVERSQRETGARTDFSAWQGAALAAAVNPEPRFASDDDLWGRADGG